MKSVLALVYLHFQRWFLCIVIYELNRTLSVRT